MNYVRLFEYSAERFRDETALVHEKSKSMLSYEELNRRATACAGALTSCLALRQQANVAILADNSREYLEMLLGCFKANVVACLLNTRLSPDETAEIVAENGIEVLVFEEKYLQHARRVSASAGQVRLVALDASRDGSFLDYERLLSNGPPIFETVEPCEGDIAVQLFTSGTTGKPKSVRHSHQGLIAFTALYGYAAKHGRQKRPLPMREVFLCMLPLYHVSGITALYALSSGGTLLLQSGFCMESFLQAIQNYGVTRTTVPQTVVSWMLEYEALGSYDLSSLVELAYGGSPMNRRTIDGIVGKLDCCLTQAYGSTEVLIATILQGDDHETDSAGGDARAYSVGRPMVGVEVEVLDEYGKACAPGVSGAILVRSPAILVDGRSAWVETGDMGHKDSRGFLYLDGRKDDLIITGGENVYPAEVERCLLELEDDIADVAVLGVPDEKWGQIPIAFVVLKAGSKVTERFLIEHCESRIAHYKRPGRIEFLERIPQDGLGKVARKKLYDLAM